MLRMSFIFSTCWLFVSCTSVVTKPVKFVTDITLKPVKAVTDASINVIEKPAKQVIQWVKPTTPLKFLP